MSYKMDSRDYANDERNSEGSDLHLDASELPTDRDPAMRQEFKRSTKRVAESFLKA